MKLSLSGSGRSPLHVVVFSLLHLGLFPACNRPVAGRLSLQAHGQCRPLQEGSLESW